jgi:NADH:ubiquinone oxidoreductase subunit E
MNEAESDLEYASYIYSLWVELGSVYEVSKHLNIPITEIEKWLAIYDSYNRRQK